MHRHAVSVGTSWIARRVVITCAIGAALLPPALAAQGTLRGVLYDSLLTGHPVAHAEVVLLGESRKATTDGDGRFTFADVAVGTHTVAHWAPWLDTLALPPLQAAVDMGADARAATVRLATPALATYQRAVCGTALEEGQGILLGEVRGPDGVPAGGVGVGVRWTETLIGVGLLERRLVATVDTSNALGMYALCGVPVGDEVALRAFGDDGVGSGELVLAIGARVQRRDLGVAPDGVVAVIRGRVTGEDGEPIVDAAVAVTGDSALVVRTDADGRFALEGVPRRSTQLVGRALGHVPALTAVEMFGAEVDVGDIRLERIPQALAAVSVAGEPVTEERMQFETRRGLGGGTFIDDEQLRRLPVITSTAVSALAQRTTIRQTRRGPMLLLRRGAGFCRPRFFVDGHDNGDISPEEEGSLMQRAKRIEVYTANFAPSAFTDFDGCGAVVVWTR